MMTASNIHYEIADRTRATAAGGIGAIHLLVRKLGLDPAIDQSLHVFKIHLPYHESDHVLGMSYNLLSGGQAIEDLERLRTDETFLDAVGARRLPDPTTAGDFLRRFEAKDIDDLMDAQNDARLRVWKSQPSCFREKAIVDVDGTIVPVCGKKKEGADFAYTGAYGYGPLVISLANTNEVLYLVNRSANRPSHDGAIPWIKRAVELVTVGGFRKILLRGDTDFSLTAHFGSWDSAPRCHGTPAFSGRCIR